MAPRLAELQSVESFLNRRLDSARDKASYQNVLSDIAADIERQNQWVSELERIDRFVSDRLNKPAFKFEPAPAAPAQPAPKPVPAKPPVEAGSKPAPAKQPPPMKKPEPKPAPKDDDTKDEPPQRAKGLQEMPAASSGMTIEFGPDGFPINNMNVSKPKTDKGAGKATVAESAGMDGATINFGPDGFPLDFPKPGAKKK
jgi:hypothetical protein